ncbi:hypothetical protein [Bartonella taylorii]|uniref:hypothetical protein n=1 Tax=Bartonella taylorii TaxID=33046 RepID=UPI001ABBCEC0|nr:hypothetical protein [Bartonella taylorii]
MINLHKKFLIFLDMKYRFIANPLNILPQQNSEKLADSNIDLGGLGVTCLSTNSETSTRIQRDQLEASLNVKVRAEYSSEEAGLMAYECAKRNYHFLRHNTHIELITDNNNDFGRIIGTLPWNILMPIICCGQSNFGQWHGQIAES